MTAPATDAATPTIPMNIERVWRLSTTGGAIRFALFRVAVVVIVVHAPACAHLRTRLFSVRQPAKCRQCRCLGSWAVRTEPSDPPEYPPKLRAGSTVAPG